jgi:hypothetical protein
MRITPKDSRALALAIAAALMAAPIMPALAQSPGIGSGSLQNGGFSAEPDTSPGGLSALGAAPTSGRASVMAVQSLYDFGTVLNGAQVKHVFKLKSVGTAPLIIGGVQTSCGCTVAKPTRSIVQPGDETDIAALFDTRTDRGPSSRIITVFTNDPKHEQLQLTMKGDVKVQVDASPSPVAFDKVKHGAEESRQVLITDAMNDKNFSVGPITNSNPNLKVTERPRGDGKSGAALTITLLKTMPAGPFSDTVKVANSRVPIEIVVFGTVLGDLDVTPAQVSFGIVPHRSGAERMVRLTNSGPHAVKITGLSSTNIAVTAVAEPIKPGQDYKITLQLRPNTPDGALRGMLAIKTDDPSQQTVQVPFYGIVGSFRG